MVAHGAHLPARIAGSHHHIIRQAGFARQFDGDDIYGLVVFKGLLNEFEKRFAVRRLPGCADYGLVLICCYRSAATPSA